MSKKSRFYTGYWGEDDDWSDSYGDSFYTSRFRGYKEKLFSWKHNDDGNIVFPEVSWGDNNIVRDKATTKLEQIHNMKAEDVIPGFIGGDLYRMLYHEAPQLTKPEKNDKEFWFDVLSSLPIYGLAMQTNKSRFWSKIATESIINSIMQELENDGQLQQTSNGKTLEQLDQKHKNQIEKAIKDALSGKGSGEEGKDGQSEMQQMISKALQNGLQNAMQEINKTRSFAQELGLDPSQLDNKDAGDGSVLARLLKDRNSLIDKFYFNADKAMEFLKRTNSFFNSAVGKPYQVQDDFLHSDSFSDVINPELFEFPFELPNVRVMTTKRSMKVDLYIDTSGSMGSALPSKDGRSSLRIIDAVSIFAYKLWRKGIVGDVYRFESDVSKIPEQDILFLERGGGTCFNEVVNHYKKQKQQGNKRMGFVLTDGCDDTQHYHGDLYWMFIAGGPGEDMQRLYPESQMRIWSEGEIMKISQWNGR